MRKLSILNRQRFTACLFYLFYIFLIFLLSGCGGGSDDNLSPELSETGSASFTVAWHDAPVIPASENILMPAAEPEPVDCGLIENIICEVRDESDASLTSASFLCSDRQGTINDIPVGTNRKFVILGEDEGGNILYHGVAPGITISADQTNDVGTIDTYYFVPTGLSATTVSSSEISLTWNESSNNAADVGYNVYRNGVFLKSVTSTPTSDTGRFPSTQYCYTVSAYDAAGNGAAGYESEQSSQDCATTDPPPTNPPPDPNPMTWATEPYATTTSEIAMVATTASDPNTPINYFFDFINSPTGGSGGSDSVWQSSTSYGDSGLGINQQYAYLVRARDGEGNATVNSSTSYAYTLANTPGYPSGGPFSNVTTNSIHVIWTANLNPRGRTEYYCENMDNETNSGWTTNLYWDSTGLSCGTSYEFRVMARNGDGIVTSWRYLDNTYTQACPPPGPPTISDGTYQLINMNYSGCTFSDPVGSLFGINFLYIDPDGDVSEAAGATVQINSSDATPWASIYGNGFEGNVYTTWCVYFGGLTSRNHSVTLTDGAGRQSNTLGVKILKPDGAN